MGRIKDVLSDQGKIKIERDKYVKFSGGELVGLFKFDPEDYMIVHSKEGDFNVYKRGRGYYVEGDKYDKDFPTLEALVKWMNKNKVEYIGIDND